MQHPAAPDAQREGQVPVQALLVHWGALLPDHVSLRPNFDRVSRAVAKARKRRDRQKVALVARAGSEVIQSLEIFRRAAAVLEDEVPLVCFHAHGFRRFLLALLQPFGSEYLDDYGESRTPPEPNSRSRFRLARAEHARHRGAHQLNFVALRVPFFYSPYYIIAGQRLVDARAPYCLFALAPCPHVGEGRGEVLGGGGVWHFAAQRWRPLNELKSAARTPGLQCGVWCC